MSSDSDVTLDLILLPYLDEDQFLYDFNLTFDEGLEEVGEEVAPPTSLSTTSTTFLQSQGKQSSLDVLSTLVIAVILLLLILLYVVGRRSHREPAPKQPGTPQKWDASDLPDDIREALTVLEKSGGRLTQKELRQKMHYYSESKISLLITDLEDRGLIRKIKKGRGNILLLNEP